MHRRLAEDDCIGVLVLTLTPACSKQAPPSHTLARFVLHILQEANTFEYASDYTIQNDLNPSIPYHVSRLAMSTNSFSTNMEQTTSLNDPTQSPTSPAIPVDTLASVTALARFEFEPGRGNDGTKIMMVEWQDDDVSRQKSGSWSISWPGKKTTFAADDNTSDGGTKRLYFLLPPGAIVPGSIKIKWKPPPEDQKEDGSSTLYMTVHPLPAIFTPELGATAKASGKKGVLHTIWAKRRLQALAKEIQDESELNLEGIALEMAMAEKQWIEQNFGIATKTAPPQGLKLDLSSVNSGISSPPLSPGMQSPRSPGGRRLTDKLKGLSIMTSDKDYTGPGVNTPIRDTNPLSPEVGDMAVSSFAAFKGDKPTKTAAPRRMVPISPPSTVSDEQAQSASASLAGIISGDNGFAPVQTKTEGDADGEDLFAVAMSPRSGDEPKSPFSIPSGEDGGGAFSRIKGIKS